jgi:hypothetical protein
MDWQDLGASGGAGFVAAILTLLGWNKRLSRVEENKADKSLCDERHKHVDDIREDVSYIRQRMDKLIDIQLNGKGNK